METKLDEIVIIKRLDTETSTYPTPFLLFEPDLLPHTWQSSSDTIVSHEAHGKRTLFHAWPDRLSRLEIFRVFSNMVGAPTDPDIDYPGNESPGEHYSTNTILVAALLGTRS